MKKVIIALIVLILLCCCSVVSGFGLFGYINLNGKCSYKGPLAPKDVCVDTVVNTDTSLDTRDPNYTPDETIDDNDTDLDYDFDADTNTAGYLTYNGDTFTMEYPEEWVVDDSGSIMFLYSQDPDTAEPFNDNMTYLNQTSTGFEVDADNCDLYADELVEALSAQYTAALEDVSVTTVDGLDSCVVEMSGTVNGYDIAQIQYAVVDQNLIHYFTFSLDVYSENYGSFGDVVESIRVK